MAGEFPAFHVTGAVHHYLRWPGSGIAYLGTCESQPQVKLVETNKAVMNDFTGPNLPANMVETGQMALLGIGLNHYSEVTLRSMLAVVAPGTRSRFSRGLMTFGRTTVELWQVYENALDAEVRAQYPGLAVGRYWPLVKRMSEDEARIGNGQDRLKVLAFECHNLVNPDRSFTLYSENDADFPAYVTSLSGLIG